jgi:hypothetical protein
MKTRLAKKKKISPEKAVTMLRKKGLYVTPSEAKNILELLYILAKLEVDQYLK